MADASTNPSLIVILIPEHHWALCQLYNSIRYVSLALRLIQSLTTVEAVFRIRDPSHPSTRWQIPQPPLHQFDSVMWA